MCQTTYVAASTGWCPAHHHHLLLLLCRGSARNRAATCTCKRSSHWSCHSRIRCALHTHRFAHFSSPHYPTAAINRLALTKMIFTSPYPAIPIPDDEIVYNYIEKHAAEIGHKPAFICGLSKREVSFAQLYTQTRQIIAGLAANGIKRGDVRTSPCVCRQWHSSVTSRARM